MIGRVDEGARALLSVPVQSKPGGEATLIEAWIDTAFDGHLVLSSRLIGDLALETLVETEAILADGSIVTLETFVCYLDWFGETIPAQVVANDGRFPLLGTALLIGRRLTIDYVSRLVYIE